ncbi:MAG TPA: tetratricopeptide repeat protein [Nitrososphaeraceae archaeon]|nr:tetratricopeptide repeat protein [Nitrososphaeraceae archaeon]
MTEALTNKGTALDDKGDYDEAIILFDETLAIAPWS